MNRNMIIFYFLAKRRGPRSEIKGVATSKRASLSDIGAHRPFTASLEASSCNLSARLTSVFDHRVAAGGTWQAARSFEASSCNLSARLASVSTTEWQPAARSYNAAHVVCTFWRKVPTGKPLPSRTTWSGRRWRAGKGGNMEGRNFKRVPDFSRAGKGERVGDCILDEGGCALGIRRGAPHPRLRISQLLPRPAFPARVLERGSPVSPSAYGSPSVS